MVHRSGNCAFINWLRIFSWIFAFLAFILSAIIDNLTATIVLITILQKIIKDKNTRLWFAGLIVIAANAGGAWSPIGDVTTTMLWIGKKVSTLKLIEFLIIPSLLAMVLPVFIASFMKPFKGDIDEIITDDKGQDRWAKGETTARNERRYVLEMQQGTWDYKSDGIKQLKYELLDIEEINSKAKLINVKL